MEQQAVMPIAEAKEMGMPHEAMLSRLQGQRDLAHEGRTVAGPAAAVKGQ